MKLIHLLSLFVTVVLFVPAVSLSMNEEPAPMNERPVQKTKRVQFPAEEEQIEVTDIYTMPTIFETEDDISEEKWRQEVSTSQKNTQFYEAGPIHKSGPNQPDENGMMPLMHAAKRGDTKSVKKLVAAGAALNDVDNAGKTALDHAEQSGHTATAKILRDKGALLGEDLP